MKKKTLTAITISFIVGLIVQLYIGDYKNAPDSVNEIAALAGGGVGYLIAVTILPIIVSTIIFFRKQSFPHNIFATMTYVILVILTIIMFVGHSNLRAMSSVQQNELEILRQKTKQECIDVTASVYDFIESVDKKDMKLRSEKYCGCLYDKITKTDLKRILSKKILIPELLNAEYKKQQEECFEICYKGVDVVKFTDLMETDSEKKSFWSSRLVSYYIKTYGEFKSQNILKTLDCFGPTFNREYSKKIRNWEKRDLTATEILNETPEIKKEIEVCYKKIK